MWNPTVGQLSSVEWLKEGQYNCVFFLYGVYHILKRVNNLNYYNQMQGLIFWILFIISGLLHVFGTYFPITFSKLTRTQTMVLSGFIAVIQHSFFKTPAVYRIKGSVNPSEVETQWIVMTFVFACLYQKFVEKKVLRTSLVRWFARKISKLDGWLWRETWR